MGSSLNHSLICCHINITEQVHFSLDKTRGFEVLGLLSEVYIGSPTPLQLQGGRFLLRI